MASKSGPKNTSKMKIHLNSFEGGNSIDYKYGIQNAFYSSTALDFRRRASQMSVLPGMRTFATNINDLIVGMAQDAAGVRYTVGQNGTFGRIKNGAYSQIGVMSSASGHGIVYQQQADQLYMTGQQTVSMYGQVTSSVSSPVFRSDIFAQSASTAAGVTNLYNPADLAYDGALRSSATNTYTLKTTLVENSTDLCAFAPDIEPFYSIQVYVVSKGTGDWTLTMHDSLNNKLAAVTVTNANLTSGQLNEFKFPAPGVRAIIKSTQTGNSAAYHFHLTSTVADGTAQVVNLNDLSSCNFQLYAYRLVKTNNGWHPATIFAGLLCVGNGQYLSTYDFSNDSSPNNQQWVRHALLLDPGYEVCGLTVNNQYLVIAAEKRSSNTTTSFQDGMLYFWDGNNGTINFKIEIPMGSPYSIYTMNNITYFYCAGSLYAWGGGQQVIKVRLMAYQNTDYLNATDTTIVNPNMMDSRYNLLMLGYPSSTTNANITYGIWSWGSVELTYPNSFCLSYLLSNGQTSNNGTNLLKIGMVKNFVDTMYTSWQYVDGGGATRYGLDILDNFSTPAPYFEWNSLIYDGQARYKMKKALRYKVSLLPLPANTTLTLRYSIDRGQWISADPVTGAAFSAKTGDTNVVVEINNARFHELQWGFTGTCTSSATSPPTITAVTMEIDPLADEVDIRKDG